MESTSRSRSNEQPEEPAGERSESASCLFAGGQTGKTTAAASLRAVHFVGVRGTRRDALVREVGPLFHGVHDLDGLVRNAYVAAQHMMEVGLFDTVSPLVDVVPDVAASPAAYELTFRVKEPASYRTQVKVQFQMPSGAPEICAGLDKGSLFGRGEQAKLSCTTTARGGTAFDLALAKPFLGWAKHASVTGQLFRSRAERPWNDARLTETGLVFRFNWMKHVSEKAEHTAGLRLDQSIALSAIWRQFMPTSSTPFKVREHAGHTTKFSAAYTVTADSRDPAELVPQRGMLAVGTIEHAGLLGDCSFLRIAPRLQLFRPLFGHFFVGASLTSEMVQPMAGRALHLLDRVYLGGPYDLRPFGSQTIGGARTSDGSGSVGATIGGEFSLLGALHIYHPLPQPRDTLFAHAFVAAGSVTPVRSRHWLHDVASSRRVAAGVGLVGVFGSFRLELNLAVPLRYAAGDPLAASVQLGVGRQDDFL